MRIAQMIIAPVIQAEFDKAETLDETSEAHPALGQPDSEADKMLLNDAEIERYARQLVMPEIGEEGQKKLLSAHVLILGAGGWGAPVIAGLAGAGIGHLTIIDDDEADITNLNRQFVHTMQRLSQPKAESAEQFVKGLNPDIRLSCHLRVSQGKREDAD